MEGGYSPMTVREISRTDWASSLMRPAVAPDERRIDEPGCREDR
jgi:hypothetical protein